MNKTAYSLVATQIHQTSKYVYIHMYMYVSISDQKISSDFMEWNEIVFEYFLLSC